MMPHIGPLICDHGEDLKIHKCFKCEIESLCAEVERLNGENKILRESVGEKGKTFIATCLALEEAREALLRFDRPEIGKIYCICEARGSGTNATCPDCAAKNKVYELLPRLSDPTALLEAHDREVATAERERWAKAFEKLTGALRPEHIFVPGLKQAIADLRHGPLPENPLLEEEKPA